MYYNPTRKQRAAELLKTATKGPSYSMNFSDAGLTEEQKMLVEAELIERYRLWSCSWILPNLKRLVPELKEPKP